MQLPEKAPQPQQQLAVDNAERLTDDSATSTARDESLKRSLQRNNSQVSEHEGAGEGGAAAGALEAAKPSIPASELFRCATAQLPTPSAYAVCPELSRSGNPNKVWSHNAAAQCVGWGCSWRSR